MANQKCKVCGQELEQQIIGVIKGVGLKCDECGFCYCWNHIREGDTERIAAGTDTEITNYYCPEGHEIQW